jgi:PilZ domain
MIMGPMENIYPLRAYDAFDRPPAEANKGFDQFDDISFSGELESERRGQPRHLTVMRAARVSSNVHQVQSMGLLRNVSEGGMSINAYREFSVGEKITVSLLDGDRIEGSVVWTDGSTIGVQFSNRIAIDYLLAKPRTLADGTRVRPPRLTLNCKAVIRVEGCLADIEICDISQRGAKIRFGRSLAIESRAQISINDLRPVSGSVKWQVEKLIGLEFHRTLTIEELSAWMANKTGI